MTKLKELVVRTLTGALFVACVVGSILWCWEAFAAFVAVVAIVAMWEFCRLTKTNFWLSAVGLILFGYKIILQSLCFHSPSTYESLVLGTFPYLLWIIVIFVRELFVAPERVGQVRNILFGQVVVAVPLGLLVFMYVEHSYELILWLFGVIWVNDTFAYLTGMLFGRHKMLERVSPKKTWEGFVGGLTFAVAASVAVVVLLPADTFLAHFPWWICALLTIVVVVAGTAGDFLESLLKRRAGVKDSGNILPGHGGVLDRFDSLLMAAPALWVALLLFYFIDLICNYLYFF